MECIVAKVNLTDCILVDDKLYRNLKKENRLVYSGVVNHSKWEWYGFFLEGAEKMKPIYVGGKLGLWDYPYHENK